MHINKTDKRILNAKLNVVKDKAERQFLFFQNHQQYFPPSAIKKYQVRKYNKTMRSVNFLLDLINSRIN
jgi:hypothetical protein